MLLLRRGEGGFCEVLDVGWGNDFGMLVVLYDVDQVRDGLID